MNSIVAAAAALLVFASTGSAQWMKDPSYSFPRTRDGKPNLVDFEYRDGVYVVGKILDRGYLVIGKQKLGFTREE